MKKFTITKINGFKMKSGSETEYEAISLRRFLEIITIEPEIIEAYRNKEIEVDEDKLSSQEFDRVIDALENALAKEIFSEVISDYDDY